MCVFCLRSIREGYFIRVYELEKNISGLYGIIVDETSDISRTEQVSMCLRYVIDGETKETFAGFYKMDSMEGEVLYELVKEAVSTLELSLGNIIAECFDGAVNMSRAHKGLATRINQCSPLGIYVHCHGHRLNLVLQDTMTEIQPLRNALGIMHSLYNFLEGSTKRHAFFKEVESEEEGWLQALVGEAPEANDGTQRQTAEVHYRTICYYTSIDKVVAEMRARFEGND